MEILRPDIRNKTQEYLKFLAAAVQMPRAVSTIFPTLNDLKERMLHGLDLGAADSVVELGPGTGAITQSILPRLSSATRYLGIEVHEGMTNFLKGRFPGLTFMQGSAENVRDFTRKLGMDSADYVISSLPWTLFPDDLQERILSGVVETLKPGGYFVTYVCLNTSMLPSARNLKRILTSSFSSVKRGPIVWKNIPPAFVYYCKK